MRYSCLANLPGLFQHLKDLIYRRHRPVHWSPSSVCALAEAELQYSDDHVSHAAYIAFCVPSPDCMSEELRMTLSSHGISEAHLLIWTTTPWTIPANMASSFHFQYVHVGLIMTHIGNSCQSRPDLFRRDCRSGTDDWPSCNHC